MRWRALGGVLLAAAALAGPPGARAGGVSGYIPLNLAPEIERDIERVMVLGDQPVLVRPIPVAAVRRALPMACQIDATLCRRVRAYLAQFDATVAVTDLSGELAFSSGSSPALPNRHGLNANAKWSLSGEAYWQPDPYVRINAGGVAQPGHPTPTGSMLSLGTDFLQLDAGYRDIWLSPLSDSSMLIGTEAPTMPSVTLSNPLPLTRLGFSYQFFLARMSYSHNIQWGNTLTQGYPRLGGMHLGLEPFPGWAVSVNRIFQFGGGARPSSATDILKGFFKPSTTTPVSCTAPGAIPGGSSSTGTPECFTRFANQAVSITSAFTSPGPTPLTVYVEYAGRNSFHGEPLRLTNTALSAGVRFPDLWRRFDLVIEASEWQDEWYSDYVWLDGLTNHGYVIGNWGGDWRLVTPGNAPGATSLMAQLDWQSNSGNLYDIQVRTLQNASYPGNAGYYGHYRRADMISFEFAQPHGALIRGLDLQAGRDVFGKSFVRLAGFLRFEGDAEGFSSGGSGSGGTSASPHEPRTEGFIDVGASQVHLGLDLLGFTAGQERVPLAYHEFHSLHLGIGVRRAITAHNDIGMRLEYDDFNGSMFGVRFLDYRYRFGSHLAAGGFLGFARYSAPTPAQGYYAGIGLQWLNLLPHWNLSLEERYFDRLQRDKLLPGDAQNGDPVESYTGLGQSLFLSYWF